MQLLRNIWEANNNAVKVLWQQQLDADREQQEHRQRLDEDEQDRLNQEKVEEEEAARKEERKKNKFKFIPILEAGIPDDPVVTPCAYALKKLDKGEYVELWYFTNDGLDEAKHKKTVDDDAMILSTLADGSMAWVSAASTRSTRSVVNDENLPFEEFCQACPRFLSAIEEAEWPGDRVRMMARFWMNIQVHKFRSLRDPIAQKTLLVYQAEQRKRWHIALKSTVGPYNLSIVNENVLRDTRERVYWEDRNRRDNERDYKVSVQLRHQIVLNLINTFTYSRFENIPTFFIATLATRYMLHATRDTLHATCYTQHAICNTLHHIVT